MSLCEKKSGGSILCIRLSGLGDIVHAMNALSLLKEQRPEARIGWIVEDRFSDLLKGHPYIDDLLIVPRKEWGGELKNPLKWRYAFPEMWRFGRMIRNLQFDVSIDFQSSIKSSWLVASARAEKRIGFGWQVSREFSPLANNTLVRVPGENCHRIERDLALLSPLGIPAAYEDAVLPWTDADEEVLDPILEQMPGNGPLVVIHPGTSEFAAFKRWRTRGYAAVADRLVDQRNARVIVTWGPGERELASHVVNLMSRESTLAPRLTRLRQLTYLLSRADLFLGSDTGPMHMASALKVPTVSLFGPKDPVQTGPFCSRSEVVTGKAECRPCTRRRCNDRRCMKSITSKQVFAAASRVLDGQGVCRAEEESLAKGCCFSFKLGPWKGEVDCTASSPDFFRWLCTPEAMKDEADAEVRGEGENRVRLRFDKSFEGFDGHVEVVEVDAPEDWKRSFERATEISPRDRRWRAATGLARAGVRVPFHGCYMYRGVPWTRRELLVCQEISRARSLDEALAKGTQQDRDCQVDLNARELLDRAAEVVKGMHRAGFCHGHMDGESIVVADGKGDEGPVLWLVELEDVRWIGWMPILLRELWQGRALARFLQSLQIELDQAEKDRFFETYFDDFVEGRYAQKLVLWAFNRAGGVQGDEPGPPAPGSSSYADHTGRAAG